ncbi:MAG: DNA translocase FtsK 4TM domain-containing protein [Planctomycetaceae bacterium]|nr:DNA translocase FtsK 4TM domain-containing protein [Planctomycetaceae bacterium]
MRSASVPLIGVLFCIASLCIAVSLVSYSAADPPEFRGFPQTETLHNWLGLPGALVAAALIIPFGYAAYLIIIPLALYGVRFLCRLERPSQTFEHPIIQCAGFMLAGLGFAGLFTFLPEWSLKTPCPLIGPGGYGGTILTVLLSSNVAATGIMIFLISMILAGFVLVGDRTAIRLLELVFEPKDEIVNQRHQAEHLAVPGCSCRASWDTAAMLKPKAEDCGGVDFVTAQKEGTEIYQDFVVQGVSWQDFIVPDTQYQETERQEHIAPVKIARAERPQSVRIDLDEEDDDVYVAEYEEKTEYELPAVDMLQPSEKVDEELFDDSVHERAVLLEKVLLDFKIKAKVVDVHKGPVITQYELRLEKGTKIRKIQQLQDDLGVELKTGSVRIVAPIPGKNTVGVELPNDVRQMVRLRDVVEESMEASEAFALPLFLGQGITGDPIVMDLAKMPHLLIAGQTGTGKSVCLNSIIVSMLMTRSPDQVRMLMIDPKQVEFGPYQRIPHLIYPVVDDMQKAAGVLSWSVDQMEERYELFKRAGVRNLTEYNKLSEDDLRRRLNMIDASEEAWAAVPQKLPYLVIVADEVGDLIKSVKEVEGHIVRLAQKSRAAGIHLILATQKPTADAFSSLIKTNLPARIAFRVSNKTDSMVILDRVGAEQLLGKGDMLILQDNEIIRGQGALVTDDEIEAINEKIGTNNPNFDEDLLEMDAVKEESDSDDEANYDGRGRIGRDDVYYKAVDLVIQKERGSISMLQTCLGIGYPRASRMMDFMEEDGIVGKSNNGKPRAVLVSASDWDRKRGNASVRRSAPVKIESYAEEEEYVEVDFVAV